MPFRVFGADVATFGRATIPLASFGFVSAVLAPSVTLGMITMPLLAAGSGHAVAGGDAATSMPLAVFAADVANFGRATIALKAYGRAAAPSRFASLYQFPWLQANGTTDAGDDALLLSDGFQVAETHDSDLINALIDLIQFDARYSVSAAVLAALRDGMGFRDIAEAFLWADLVDSFIASEVPTGMAQITVFLRDGFQAGDAADSFTTIMAALRDGFHVTLTLASGDDEYTAWVMTTQTRAMRSYSNFPFNSFAVMDGQLLAAGDRGIYRMGGKTDAGATIRAAIRTGLMNFGSMAMKSAPVVYIGATTGGDLLLRVQATTTKGADLQQTYRMVPAVTDAPREHRVPVGKGFRSVYWTFELANDDDGSAFEVHEWHLLPMQHTGKLT